MPPLQHDLWLQYLLVLMTHWLSFDLEKESCFFHDDHELVVAVENSKLSVETPPKTRLELRLALFQRQMAEIKFEIIFTNEVYPVF